MSSLDFLLPSRLSSLYPTPSTQQQVPAGGSARGSNSAALERMYAAGASAEQEEEVEGGGALQGTLSWLGAAMVGDDSEDGPSFDVDSSGFTFGHKDSDKVTGADGEEVEVGHEASGGVRMGGGVAANGSYEQTNADGSSASAEVTAGMIATEDGERGVSSGSAVSMTPAGGDTATEVEVDGSLTNRGAAGAAKLGGSDDKTGNSRFVGLGGGLRVYTQQQEDGSWLLTCELSASVSGGVGNSREEDEEKPDQAQHELSLEGSVGASLTFTHVLTAEEVEHYLDAIRRAEAGEEVDGPAELGLITSGRLALEQGTDPVVALFDAGAAARLGTGDALTLTTSASMQGSGSVEKGPVQGEVSAGIEASRTLQISRVVGEDGAPRVHVTVSFAQADHQEAGTTITPSGDIEAVTGHGSVSREAQAGSGMTFVLDPRSADYAAHYGEITTVATQGGLSTLAARPDLAPLVEGRQSNNLLGFAWEAGMSVLGFAASWFDRNQTHEAVAADREGGLSAQVGGEDAHGAAINFKGADIVGGSKGGSMDGKLEDGQMDVSFTSEKEMREARSPAQVAPGEVPDTFLGGIWNTIQKPEGQALSDALSESSRVLQVLNLSDADLAVVLERARDRSGWQSAAQCVPSVDIQLPWATLRHSLLAPIPAPDQPAACLEDRNRLSRLRSMADFVSKTGQEGVDLFNQVARNWQGMGGDQDLGVVATFPTAIEGERDAWFGFLDTVDHLLPGEGEPAASATITAAQHEALSAEGQRLRLAVESCQDFPSARAKVEMLDSLGQRLLRLRLARRDEQGECDQADLDTPAAGQDRWLGEVARLERLLLSCKREENGLFATGVRTKGLARAFAHEGTETNHLHDVRTQLLDLYALWMDRIVDLRHAYDQADAAVLRNPSADGECTVPVRHVQESGGERNLGLEPDVRRMKALLLDARSASAARELESEETATLTRLETY